MRIACPSCTAAYDVPDSLVPGGRVVRCARCGGDWMPVDAPPAPSQEPDVEPPPREAASPPPLEEPAIAVPRPVRVPEGAPPTPGPSAMERLAAHPALPQSRFRLRMAWAASLLLLILAGWGAYTWRSQIVEVWPPSARMYAAFGMHPGENTTR
jgi:predicted Zn finger-like uncharacterized protein